MINTEETDINSELFQKHLSFQWPSEMRKAAYSTNNRKENEKLVNVIKSGLGDLQNEIKEISDDEIEIEKPDKIVDINKILLSLIDKIKKGKDLKY